MNRMLLWVSIRGLPRRGHSGCLGGRRRWCSGRRAGLGGRALTLLRLFVIHEGFVTSRIILGWQGHEPVCHKRGVRSGSIDGNGGGLALLALRLALPIGIGGGVVVGVVVGVVLR